MLLDARDPAALGVFRRPVPLVEAAEPCQAPEYVRRVGEVWRKPVVVVSAADAAACLTVRRIGPLRQVVLPPFTPYSAVFPTTGSADLLAAAFESEFDETILHLPPGDGFREVVASRGWNTGTLQTYVLDPGTARDPATWSQGTARNYRRGAASLRAAVETDGARVVAALCSASYARSAHRPPLPATRFATLAESIVDAGLGVPWVCRDATGRPVAGLINLGGGRRGGYWMAGGVPGDGMTVLLGTLFDRLAAEGVDRFDFFGANTPSIAEFKRRFGGRLVSYDVVRHTKSRWLSAMRSVRGRVRGRLP